MKNIFKKITTAITTGILVTVLSAGVVFAATNISIDGLYDDWKNVPAQEITYTGYNTKDVHTGQIYTDGEYMYVHFKISKLYSSAAPFGQFYISVNGVKQEMHIFNSAEGFYSANAPTTPGEYKNLSVGIRGQQTNWSPKTLGSDVIFDCYNEPWNAGPDAMGSEFEFKVPLSKVADAFGVKKENISVITITNTSLGNEGVSIAGTPTGPIIGILIAVGMVGIGSVIAAKNKKNNSKILTEQERGE